MYSLYNEVIDKQLSHPQVGLWYTSDLKEAEEMKKACVEYMQSMNLPQEAIDKIYIIEVESGEKVL